MLLGKLQGYDIDTCEYTVEGVLTERPKSPFCVVTTTLPSDYDDISSVPEYWVKFGILHLGTVVGFKDWMALRAIILPLITGICGTDYANFDDLNAAQKDIALKFFPTKIVKEQGFVFFVTKSGGVDEAFANIEYFLSLAEPARKNRYIAFMKYGYQYLGTTQGLKAELALRKDFLDVTYIKRGVLYFSEDDIDGLGDWVEGLSTYTVTGLKPKIDNSDYVLDAGMDVTTFINTLVAILEEGIY